MKKILVSFLLCTSLFSSEYAGNELDNLTDEHKNVNSIHEDQLTVLNNLVALLKETLLVKENILFELKKEADLLYLVILTEGERFNMITARIKRDLSK